VCWNGFHEKWARTMQRNRINEFPLSNMSVSLRSRLHAPLYSSPAPLALRHQHSPTANRGGCACILHVQLLLETLHRTPHPRAPYSSDWCWSSRVQNPWHTRIAWRCNRPTFDHVSSNPTEWRYGRTIYQFVTWWNPASDDAISPGHGVALFF